MVERNPWYSRVKGPFPESYGCVGVKPDGGGSMRGRGTVGKMRVHHARLQPRLRRVLYTGPHTTAHAW